jgi:hypothetical protein
MKVCIRVLAGVVAGWPKYEADWSSLNKVREVPKAAQDFGNGTPLRTEATTSRIA